MRKSGEDVKQRFASLIENLLRSSADTREIGPQDELQASVQQSPHCVLVRLHWRKPSAPAEASRSAQATQKRLVCYRVYPQLGERNVVIMVTRDESEAGVDSGSSAMH